MSTKMTKDQLSKELSLAKSKATRAENKFLKLEKEKQKLQNAVSEKENKLKAMGAQLHAARKKAKASTGENSQARKMRENNERKLQASRKRSSMVEKDLALKNSRLTQIVDYYYRHPMQAIFKHWMLALLVATRRWLPLPERMKLRISRRMTAMALRLGYNANYKSGSEVLHFVQNMNND